jgi:hypothetical protein
MLTVQLLQSHLCPNKQQQPYLKDHSSFIIPCSARREAHRETEGPADHGEHAADVGAHPGQRPQPAKEQERGRPAASTTQHSTAQHSTSELL